ncbi:MAG: dual specificity protein phosphatase family protein [Gammaproteobacteria bacterium]|nr:dual specificity protein phosphatase family protein [Gammaproteobacteria bacterium]
MLRPTMLAIVLVLAVPAVLADEAPSIPNFHQVNRNLFRGGRPRAEGVQQLAQMGVRTIVNLERGLFEKEPSEVKKEREWAQRAGMKFIHVPLHPFIAPSRQQIEQVLALITDPANQPVFVHCDRGSDRTGVVIAAYRIRVEGWSVQRAYEEMMRYGHNRWLIGWKTVLENFGAAR